MSTAVLCIARTRSQAETIVDRLKSVGFSNDDISVLFPDRFGTKDFAHEKGTKAPEGAATGVGVGGVVGGALGWLAGLGALTIPGVGPLIAAGPIMAALSGAAVGGALGGLTGALVGMGIPEYEAKQYEGKLRDGNILISVHADNKTAVERAKEIFRDAEAEDISSASEARVPKRDKPEPEPHDRPTAYEAGGSPAWPEGHVVPGAEPDPGSRYSEYRGDEQPNRSGETKPPERAA